MEAIRQYLKDSRRGKNTQPAVTDLRRQLVYRRAAGHAKSHAGRIGQAASSQTFSNS